MPLCKKCGDPEAVFSPSQRKDCCRKCAYERVRNWRKNNPERHRASARNQRNNRIRHFRRELLEAYGHACECCGESRFEFLALDHRHGGGEEERRQFTSRDKYYRHIRDLGYPKDKYRLLCHNCNQSIGAYGYCPHQLERDAAENLQAAQGPEGIRR